MEINDLETLLLVARMGSFAAAAREQNLDPSSISRSVTALENELGARLFVRNTRNLALTEAGTVFLEKLPLVLEELRQARAAVLDVSGEVRGRLRVTASNAFGLRCVAPVLPAFCRQYPALELDLLLTEAPVDLIAERIDLALRVGNLRDSNLVAVRLLDVCYHVVASPGWLRTQSAPLHHPEQLQAIPCLCFAMQGFREHWHFAPRAGGAGVQVAVKPRLLSTNALMLRETALNGLGPTLLADWIVGEDLRSGALVDLFPAYSATTTNAPVNAWAVYPNRAHVPTKVRVFIEHLKAVLGAG